MCLSVEGHLVACLRATRLSWCHDFIIICHIIISWNDVSISILISCHFSRKQHFSNLHLKYWHCSSSLVSFPGVWGKVNSSTYYTLIPGTLWWMKAWLWSNMCTQIFSVPLLRIIFIFPLISTSTTQHWLQLLLLKTSS